MNKIALAQKIKTLEGLSKEDKHHLLELLNTKTYGLVWEDKLEAVEEELKMQMPILQEVVEKKIISSRLLIDNNLQNIQPVKPQISLDFGTETDSSKSEVIVQNTAVLHTQNINHALIEGDNLHALTVLNYTHANKIDVIYIDPPYNTGNKDFKYNDSFVDKEDGYRHSKWLSFMAKRLRLTKNLLSDKGVIFISIDDNEQAQLKLLCDEVFGEVNFVEKFVWRTDGNFDNQAQIKNCHEYLICYSKSGLLFKVNAILDSNVHESSKLFKDEIQNTVVKNGAKNPISKIIIPVGFPTLFEIGIIETRFDKFPFYHNDVKVSSFTTQNETIVESGWAAKKQLEEFILSGFQPIKDTKGQETYFKLSSTGSIEVIKKRENQSHILSILSNLGNTQSTSNSLKEMGINFSFPKPLKLIQYVISITGSKNATVLDFFAGSGTTLHAVMALNTEDGGSRQCILVTNNENNICEEVTYERNKRVIGGYTNAKGDFVSGLGGNNLRYYRTGYVGRERTIKNKKALVNLAAEMLCLKEGVYQENSEKTTKQIKVFEENDKAFMVIYDEEFIDEAVLLIQQIELPNPIKVYIFANSQYPYTEDFEEVLDKIELCALPDAIYRAYQRLLPKEESTTNL